MHESAGPIPDSGSSFFVVIIMLVTPLS